MLSTTRSTGRLFAKASNSILNSKIEYHQLTIKSSTNRQNRVPLLKIKLYDYKKKVFYKSYSSSESSNLNKINSTQLAREFVSTLTFDERRLIKEEIAEQEKQEIALGSQSDASLKKDIPKPLFAQLFLVGLQCGLPFIGFGFVDNFLMIIAGDLIEEWIGTMIPITTMAAAGLGNAVSDVAGIGLAHRIEAVAMRFVKLPRLTTDQWSLPLVNWIAVISKSVCIFIGCVIGMVPLLFMSEHKDKPEKSEI